MKSELPKGLFEVCGAPMVDLVGRAMKAAGIARVVIVVGHEGQRIVDRLGDGYEYVWQREQLGTGHAVRMAESAFAGHTGALIVAPGDVPLLTGAEIEALISKHCSSRALATIGSCMLGNPRGYGRIVRDTEFRTRAIVEDKDADREQIDINEVNTGVYAFDLKTLFEILPELSSENAQGEYYLTDAIKLIYERTRKVETEVFADPEFVKGVNDRWQLAEANAALKQRLLRDVCLSGVSVVDPTSTTIEIDVEVGQDTLIHPGSILRSGTKIGARCEIGPHTLIEKSAIGDDTSINMSRVNESRIGSRVKIGPFAHVRPGSHVGDDVKIGNFVELKKAEIGPNAAVSHLSYIGDATVGAGANIGAGTITCNYDGYRKHRTEIGAGSFVGSNSTLVAPLIIGQNAFVAAGSVITKDIPDEALGMARERQENREGWVPSWRKRMESK